MNVAQRKLGKHMADQGARAVAADVKVSEVTLRSHRDGKTVPTARARERYRAIGIEPDDWTTEITAVVPIVPTVSPVPPVVQDDAPSATLLATLAEVDRALLGAMRPRDRLAFLRTKLAIAKALGRDREAFLSWYPADVAELRESVHTALADASPSATALIDEALAAEADELATRPDPYQLLVELLESIEALLESSDLPEGDRASALSLKRLAASAQTLILDRGKDDIRRRWEPLKAKLVERAAKSRPVREQASRPNLSTAARVLYAAQAANDLRETRRALERLDEINPMPYGLKRWNHATEALLASVLNGEAPKEKT